MSTKMLLAALVGGVVAFFLGWLVFGMLLQSYYEANSVHYEGLYRGEDEMRLYGIFLSNLCWAGLLAYIFDKWANIRSFGPGFMGGAIVFALTTAGFDLMMWSTMNMGPYKMYIVDVLVQAVFGGIIGGVVGFVLGRGKTA